MSRTLVAHGFLSVAVWLIFGVSMLLGTPEGPGDSIWVVTSSERVASHPTLVRSAFVGPDRIAPDRLAMVGPTR